MSVSPSAARLQASQITLPGGGGKERGLDDCECLKWGGGDIIKVVGLSSGSRHDNIRLR